MENDLIIAVQFGSKREVLDLLAEGADVNAVNKTTGKTPLMAAATWGRLAMVHLLLEHGADVQIRGRSDRTAMDYALYDRHVRVARALRQANSPMSFSAAALLGDTQAVLDLLAQEPDRMEEALSCAAWAGKPAVMAALLKKGGDIHQTFTRDRYYMLNIAAGHGQEAMARFLIEQGARIDAVSGTGRTALMAAVTGVGEESYVDRSKVLRFLLEQGADVNATDNEGMTALMYAVKRRKLDFARLLLEYKADIHLSNAKGQTALMLAEEKDYTEFLDVLSK